MNDREKKMIALHKLFLNLSYKIEKYKIVGVNPPEYLLEKFKIAERYLRLISKALK